MKRKSSFAAIKVSIEEPYTLRLENNDAIGRLENQREVFSF